jgi:hypothetical protein
MSTNLHLSAPRPGVTRNGSATSGADRAARTATAARRPDLERQSITFTIGLYLFICTVLLSTHLVAAGQDDASPAQVQPTSAPATPSAAAATAVAP